MDRTSSHGLPSLLSRFEVHAKKAVAYAQIEAKRILDRQARAERLRAIESMNAIEPLSQEPLAKCVLIDGMFDNPNLWLRFSLIRAALGLKHAREIGLVGPHNTKNAILTFKKFGIPDSDIVRVDAVNQDHAAARHIVHELLAQTRTAADILNWQMPHGYPTTTTYDILLKRQRKAQVDLTDPLLEDHLLEIVEALQSAQTILDTYQPDLLLLSHAITPRDSALAWLGQLRGIDSIIMYGNYGTPRYWRVHNATDFTHSALYPTLSELDALPSEMIERLRRCGAEHLERRFQGQTNDIGATYAFQKNIAKVSRQELANVYGWTTDRPVVTVYASNWFDYPHGCGMSLFLDFLDWIQTTLDCAKANDDVYWIFKPHPCDKWYGGVTLKDLMPESIPPHMILAHEDWNALDVMNMTDAIVTYHGTAGIEYATIEKPVLVADRGWYDQAGFVLRPDSRTQYQEFLSQPWWNEIDVKTAKARADVFAGLYFGVPEWQDDFMMKDDSQSQNLMKHIPDLLGNNTAALATELGTIQRWYFTSHGQYHTYKMFSASSFKSSAAT
ncbi:hypothetical protein [Magnetovibrio sp.]|uniref:capsular polysaccharide export protein, LipB/KpsS family n=1 Tax=Magnetovibrio sp. TaxID=2024836 RepID=UPI002F925826